MVLPTRILASASGRILRDFAQFSGVFRPKMGKKRAVLFTDK
jgi:hypothetical protein